MIFFYDFSLIFFFFLPLLVIPFKFWHSSLSFAFFMASFLTSKALNFLLLIPLLIFLLFFTHFSYFYWPFNHLVFFYTFFPIMCYTNRPSCNHPRISLYSFPSLIHKLLESVYFPFPAAFQNRPRQFSGYLRSITHHCQSCFLFAPFLFPFPFIAALYPPRAHQRRRWAARPRAA